MLDASKLPSHVIEALDANDGLGLADRNYSIIEAFDMFLKYEGIIGFTQRILQTYSSIEAAKIYEQSTTPTAKSFFVDNNWEYSDSAKLDIFVNTDSMGSKEMIGSLIITREEFEQVEKQLSDWFEAGEH